MCGYWRLFPVVICVASLPTLSAATSASPSWLKAKSGSFELISDDGRRSATQALGQFEQFRFALGSVLGKPDLKLDPPLRIILSRAAGECQGFHQGRDRLTACARAEGQLSPELLRSLTRVLLEENFSAIPKPLESAMESFFSTIQSNATHVTWGAPPPVQERTRDWALLHRIITQPEYSAKAHIFLHNLAAGMDRKSAIRNAFGEEAASFEEATNRYYAAGAFQTASAPSRPLNPDRDFSTTALLTDEGALMRADLLDSASAGLYKQLLDSGKHLAEANEGLGLLAVRDSDGAAARAYFHAAAEAGSKNVVAMTANAGLQDDWDKAVKILQGAIAIDPKYAPARWMLGEKTDDNKVRQMQWKQATALAPRNFDWWAKYAQFCIAQRQFAEAGRAWVEAAKAAPDEAHRNEYLTARGRIDEQRLQADDEERSKERAAQTKELDRLKSEARKEIASLEAKANGNRPSPKDAVFDWAEINGVSASGTLDSIECAGKQYRLHFTGKTGTGELVFSVRDPAKVEFSGEKVKLSCVNFKPRSVTLTYKPASSGLFAGEVLTLDFAP